MIRLPKVFGGMFLVLANSVVEWCCSKFRQIDAKHGGTSSGLRSAAN
jgi:hypothetical protein